MWRRRFNIVRRRICDTPGGGLRCTPTQHGQVLSVEVHSGLHCSRGLSSDHTYIPPNNPRVLSPRSCRMIWMYRPSTTSPPAICRFVELAVACIQNMLAQVMVLDLFTDALFFPRQLAFFQCHIVDPSNCICRHARWT